MVTQTRTDIAGVELPELEQALHDLGQSLWVDNITRAMLRDGVLEGYIDDLSLTGLTSNPTIFDKAISGGDDYDEQIAESSAESTEEVFFEIAIADLTDAANLFLDVHKKTDGLDGFVSLEVSPLLADEALTALQDYERASGGRIGLYAESLATGAKLTWRADERFVMCSTFKASLAACVLARVDRGEDQLAAIIPYGPADLLDYAPTVKVEDGVRRFFEWYVSNVLSSGASAANP